MKDQIDMNKVYSAKDVEDAIYDLWMQANVFAPENSPLVTENSESFSIVLPPPNVTGTLHMGHASMLAIEDVMVRFARMQGKYTVWIPGTDHASIATESKVEKILIEKEGKTRHDLGRERFLNRVKQFAQDSHDTIVNQCKKMGTSLDWSREAYTLDDTRNKAVNVAFERMYQEGFIYRGYRVINWDPLGQTSVSDDEVVYKEGKAILSTFKYHKDIPISVATTRLETKVGDTAIAVHPNDDRYKQYVGKEFTVPFMGTDITLRVVADESVDMSFGTGALGVTPAHSAIDADIAKRHKLPMKQVIGEDGRMTKQAGDILVGKITKDARVQVAMWLKEQGLLEREEEIDQNLSVAERSGGPIEPLPKEQWFVDVNKSFWFKRSKHAPIKGLPWWRKVTLKEVMQHVVRGGHIDILPERFHKTYFHWIDDLRDWNISRQIWFGHRIPVWYCLACEKPSVNASVEQTWFVVRHGQTDWNKELKMQGHTDIPLNDEGRAQAHKTAEQLKSQNIALIVSSDLGRCKETAEIIAKELGVEIEFDARLRERNLGSLEGYTYEESKEKFHVDARSEGPAHDAELYSELEARISEAFNEHKIKHAGKNVVIVSHGGAIRQLRKHMQKLSHEQMLAMYPTKNAGIFSFDKIKSACPTCENDLFTRDEDTLDTWFSSGLWTFSVFGWPEKTEDLMRYHPTTIVESGYDILFFWIARMILMSTYLLGEIPFKTVYLHGLVRDDQGRKMSKSLDNIINPLDMIEKYGADATRLSLLIGGTPGNDLALSEEKIAGFRNFTNKLWNMSRFVLGFVDEMRIVDRSELASGNAIHDGLLSKLDDVTEKVTTHLEKYELSIAGELLREFTWNVFADKYIEFVKHQNSAHKMQTDLTLQYALQTILKLWHPFMPFVTEEIWRSFRIGDEHFLMITAWPKRVGNGNAEAEKQFDYLWEVISSIRKLKADHGVAMKNDLRVEIKENNESLRFFLTPQKKTIIAMCRLQSIDTDALLNDTNNRNDAIAIFDTTEIRLKQVVDFEETKKKQLEEIKILEEIKERLEKRLENVDYKQKAPQKARETEGQLKEIEKKIASIQYVISVSQDNSVE